MLYSAALLLLYCCFTAALLLRTREQGVDSSAGGLRARGLESSARRKAVAYLYKGLVN
jgi:hypothetical protein